MNLPPDREVPTLIAGGTYLNDSDKVNATGATSARGYYCLKSS